MNKLPLKIFLSRAHKNHGNKYDYSKVLFDRTADKVKIKCPVHGNFYQKVDSHMCGCGCKKCATDKSRHTKEEFILNSKKIFKNKFDYSLVHDFKNNKENIWLTCKICGHKFTTNYNRHISKQSGCFKCEKKLLGIKHRKTNNEFIEEAKKIHGNKYDYSLCHYTQARSSVIIICNKHGKFLTDPANHIALRNGCPKCRKSKGEQLIENFLNKHKIKYSFQKTFDDLKSPKNYKLRFDFYIPSQKTLIEFDGSQHTYSDSIYYDKRIKLHDRLKTKYALKHKIKLLRILANQIKKVDQILIKNLKE